MTTQLAFSQEEYRARVDKLRSEMAGRGLDCLLMLNPVSVKYLTGYETWSVGNYPCLILGLDGAQTLVVWELEEPGVLLTSQVKDAAVYRTGEDKFRFIREALHKRGLLTGTIGIEKDGRLVPGQDHDRLALGLEGARLRDASGIVKTLMRVKSSQEIEYLRQAARITETAMRAAIEATVVGVTDNDVAAAASHALLRAGSEFPCLAPLVTTGRRSSVPHSTHHRVKINHDETVVIEIGGCYERYTAPLMRTVFVGSPPGDARTLAGATVAAMEKVIASMRPGVPAEEVGVEAAKELPLDDPSLVFHHTYGYSIGLGFPPKWADDESLVCIRGNRTPLEEGMVFHVTMSVRRRGEYGVALSETMMVTPKGGKTLTAFPRQYFDR